MIIHYILLSSSYSEHCRIALHYPVAPGDDIRSISETIDRINSLYGGKPVSLSVHVKVTEDDSWESVIRKDPYFKDVRPIGSSSEFEELILRDRYLRGVDVADYILTKYKCTHLKLEKLTYLCYADYLCDTGEQLFEDKVYAFKYGPVIDSVRQKYELISKEHPGKAFTDEQLKFKPSHRLATKSRITFSEDGSEKLFSIERTLAKYASFTGEQLMELTHREGTPWSACYKAGKKFIRISDELIQKYHSAERI